jgi:hypothetical protein
MQHKSCTSPCNFPGREKIPLWVHLGAQKLIKNENMTPKWHEWSQSVRKCVHEWHKVDPLSAQVAQMAPKVAQMAPKVAQKAPKWTQFLDTKLTSFLYPKMGVKMEAKWEQMCKKGAKRCQQIETATLTVVCQKDAKVDPK